MQIGSVGQLAGMMASSQASGGGEAFAQSSDGIGNILEASKGLADAGQKFGLDVAMKSISSAMGGSESGGSSSCSKSSEGGGGDVLEQVMQALQSLMSEMKGSD